MTSLYLHISPCGENCTFPYEEHGKRICAYILREIPNINKVANLKDKESRIRAMLTHLVQQSAAAHLCDHMKKRLRKVFMYCYNRSFMWAESFHVNLLGMSDEDDIVWRR